MTNHTQHQQQHQWQPAPPTHHDNGQWKGHDGYKDSHGNTYDSGHWKGHDGYKDSHGNTYDSGHWKGNDAYPPQHNNQHQHDQGHWQAAPVRDTNGNPVQPGESTILPIQDPRTVPDQHQGHQWQQPQPINDVQGNPIQAGESTILPIQDPRTVPDQWQPTQPMRDEQGNLLQPGEFSTLPVPDQLSGQHSWEQADVNALAAPAPTADAQVAGEAAASAVSWEPVQGSLDMGQSGNEFSIMPITMV